MTDMSPASHPAEGAYVVFSPHASWRGLKLLRAEFRHCFLVVKTAAGWMTIDPLQGHIEIMTHDAPEKFHFVEFFKNEGFHIVYKEKTPNKNFYFDPFSGTCVGIVKRFFGLRGLCVQTPYQLYKHLIRRGGVQVFPDPARDLFFVQPSRRSA